MAFPVPTTYPRFQNGEEKKQDGGRWKSDGAGRRGEAGTAGEDRPRVGAEATNGGATMVAMRIGDVAFS